MLFGPGLRLPEALEAFEAFIGRVLVRIQCFFRAEVTNFPPVIILEYSDAQQELGEVVKTKHGAVIGAGRVAHG